MRSIKPAGTAAFTLAVTLAAACAAAGIAGAEPAPSPAPPPAPKQVIDGDGTFAVGTDIVPGTYRSDGPRDGNACYWRRIGGEKTLDSAMTKKPQVVLIEPTDTAFRTDRCQTWQLTECPPTCAPVPQPSAGLPDVLKGFVPQARPPAPPTGGG
ncbi:hypothetical protein [Mycolicibacter arupensis]|jgi:hypothetical protein|uniref:Lipoprotein n=2 Tax=Mycolicibacter arupensis TaxID=342002 RepID=A0A0F5N174_9MYCO|nr:hypothetical protein [Mycolicibacter arupensis]KAA1431958.1 hypothetical protein F0402_05875 [Mycolicibacter arupensis]KKC00028.1 hypothetical protein WR43_07100 [Mycolicibacter arupensis]MCV7274644.1 hypothetical protein [Mycolicibacter arupensis]TXI53670.1 MAG: hypothetical protein E6Q54_16140 [Mycolicibacter arupensis]